MSSKFALVGNGVWVLRHIGKCDWSLVNLNFKRMRFKYLEVIVCVFSRAPRELFVSYIIASPQNQRDVIV
jgi:hypothetical protein